MDHEERARQVKIFPRNLTAKSDFVVRGNPASSRPEDSVGNTIPGLEYDERNLDKYFFPGLIFEFQRFAGPQVRFGRPLVRAITSAGPVMTAGLRPEDVDYRVLNEQQLVHLWAVRSASGRRFNFFAKEFDDAGAQLGAWRAVRDLEQEFVVLLVATIESYDNAQVFEAAVNAFATSESNHVERNKDGIFMWAIFADETSPMLNEDGVINLLIPPGELQSTMCTPWQYDFRDCRCYYWASNRPDVAASDDRTEDFLKFLRRDRLAPTIHSTDHEAWLSLNGQNHVDVINSWESLPVVLNDKEVPQMQSDVRERFRFLATVEHALAVEYLYAYHSLDTRKEGVAPAAADLLSVAIDEMRHFRWVNEILGMLGEAPVIGRALDYGGSFEFRRFELVPLTREKLDWFIQVEKPSQSLDAPGQIDGMYVRLYAAIADNPKAFPQPEELLRLIKLLMDEGETHYQIFMGIRQRLHQYVDFEDILYPVSQDPAADEINDLLTMSDTAYGTLLALLAATFELRDQTNGVDLQKSVRSMHAMDALNRLLAQKGKLPRFTLPDFAKEPQLKGQRALDVAALLLDKADKQLNERQHSSDVEKCIRTCIDANLVALSQLQDAARMIKATII